jgi:thiamine pyrophosphate-dependent acetolactate synthase large subunit-like protein
MTTAAEAVVERLESLGVEVVFGIPGVDNLAFFDALDRSSIRCVLVRHEATAGFAADAWFRITGRPAVCFTTAGPGATNALTAMGEAWASGSTFLHMTTAVSTAYGAPLPPRGLPHYHPHQRSQFDSLVTEAVHCSDPNELAETVERVLSSLGRPPHRSGFLEVPSDLLGAPVDVIPSPGTDVKGAETQSDLHSQGIIDSWSISSARAILAAAQRPLVWAGSGAVRDAAGVMSLAEALSAPVIVTHSAKRGFGHFDHPLVVAYPPHEPAVAALVESSDAVLVLGSDLDAMMTMQFRLALPAPMIQVDVESDHIGMQYPVEVAIVGTVAAAVAALREQADWRSVHRSSKGAARAAEAREATLASIATDSTTESARVLLGAIDAALPSDGIAVCDMSIAGYWAAGLLNLAPNRQLLYPIGWGTLGFGIPAAIGAASARPGTRTICIAGDAGASYALGDLATIAQEGLPITLVVADDGGYGMLRFAAEQRFGRTFATNLMAPDYAAVARAFGIAAWTDDFGSTTLPETIGRALMHPDPTVVHVRGALVPPKMALLGSPTPRGSSA